MSRAAQSRMTPEAFEVNRTWLAFRINQRPIESGDGAHDIFVLQDAGSMFIFGTALGAANADGPPEAEAESLLQRAWSHREEWPEELIVPGHASGGNAFSRVAARIGITVRAVPEAKLSFYIKDVQTAFEEYLSGGPAGDV